MEFIAELGTAMSRFIFWGSSFLTQQAAPGLVSIGILFWLLISILAVSISARVKLNSLRWLERQVRSAKDEYEFAAQVNKISQESKKVRTQKNYAHVTAAWDEFRETFIQDNNTDRPVLRNSVRPSSFFNLEDLHFGPGFSRYMPGLFVTVGLFFTFLGLISALQQITGLSDASPEDMRARLRDMINADVPWSQQSRAYEKVFRPQRPRPKDTPPKQREASSRSRHDHSRAGIFGSTYGGDIFSPLKPNKKSSAAPASVAATRRVHKNENHKLGNSTSSNPTLLNQASFPSLTDRMIAYGPPAAAAVLAYLEAPDNGRTRPLVSPKTMEGLEWVHAGKGIPSIHLKDAIEHLLIKFKTSGIDLDALFQSSNDFSSLLNQPVHSVSTQEKPDLADGQKFPPLANNAEGRLKLLREHVDALEDLGMWERTFDQRKALSVALGKLRDQSLELRPSEVGELQALYEKLRHGQKGRRK